MYQAKAAGRNTYQVFDSAMSARARLRFALEDSLRAAVESGRLAVHYQPKLDMATGNIVGVEALAAGATPAWDSSRVGVHPPGGGDEPGGDAGRMGARRRLQTSAGMAGPGPSAMPVAVNLSPRQFAHQPVVEMVTRVLKNTGWTPRCWSSK